MDVKENNILLALDGVSLAFGGLQAVEQVSFGVAAGAVKAVIGPNGAGKTTLFNLVTGFLSPQAGRIIFQGQEIQGRPAHWIARQGIARTFQLVQLFDHMTVLENVMVGRHRLSRAGLLAGAAQFPWTRAEEKVIRQKALEALEFVGLADRANQPAAVLPLGLKRMLEIARALASAPTLLLLDEPASGLDAVETERLQDLILGVAPTGPYNPPGGARHGPHHGGGRRNRGAQLRQTHRRRPPESHPEEPGGHCRVPGDGLAGVRGAGFGFWVLV